MNTPPESKTTLAVYTAAILGALLIVGAMVWILRSYTRPAPVNAARIEERRKALAETQAARQQLETYGWVDQGKGIVRLPIQQAMELELREWKNPEAGRSNLMSRVDKAFPAPPPAAPSPFE